MNTKLSKNSIKQIINTIILFENNKLTNKHLIQSNSITKKLYSYSTILQITINNKH